jgi:hypothetical protein
MPSYPMLPALLAQLKTPPEDTAYEKDVIPYLVDLWLDDYERTARDCHAVETTASGFSYLFDLEHERLIAAWGVSRGPHQGGRDKARMAGHPLSAGPKYHRGHAIPHSLGGPTDINLVPQLGAVNVGPFRELEREAVRTPGALYFTYWIYQGSKEQTPSGVEQGLLYPGRAPLVRTHRN